MTQFALGTIPLTTSGPALAAMIQSQRDANNTSHYGATEPSYKVKGMIWLDDSGTPWLLKIYDGSAWTQIGTFNATTDIFTPSMVALDPIYAKGLVQGRLTLESGVPVSFSDQLAKTNLYFTPYMGNGIALFVSSQWVYRSFSEITESLSGLTTGKPYDVFAFDNAGTVDIELLVWTNDTTRATALALQNGIHVKSGDATRRYLGTIYTSATGQCEDSLKKRYVWNMYNRRLRGMAVYEATDSWAYSITTIRQANGSALNQLDFVRGLDEEEISAKISVMMSGTAGALMKVFFGLDVTNAKVAGSIAGNGNASSGGFFQMIALYDDLPGVGRHILTWLESSTATGTNTFFGDAGVPSAVQSGIIGNGMF